VSSSEGGRLPGTEVVGQLPAHCAEPGVKFLMVGEDYLKVFVDGERRMLVLDENRALREEQEVSDRRLVAAKEISLVIVQVLLECSTERTELGENGVFPLFRPLLVDGVVQDGTRLTSVGHSLYDPVSLVCLCRVLGVVAVFNSECSHDRNGLVEHCASSLFEHWQASCR